MDKSIYIKKCPRCGTEIEPEQSATTGDNIYGGITGASGAVIGYSFDGSVGASQGERKVEGRAERGRRIGRA